MEILIVDDNIAIQHTLTFLISKLPGCTVAGRCGSIAEASTFLGSTSVDLVLLDIELQDGTGFELLDALPDINFKVIFITAFDQHAIKAIKTGALDYLLKPVDEEEFRAAITRAGRQARQSAEQLSIAREHMSPTPVSNRIVLREYNVIRVLSYNDILYCYSHNGYTNFFLTDNRKITVSRSIKEYEQMLPPSVFIRVHQSYIININYIDFYNREGFIVLKNSLEVPVSVRKREEVVKTITNL
ncbi:LytR/AlgR family response regulator transcription factor [Taibaiella koreensis]|uniref:LytR/AlgR family response regulator transcription factor n=1 Tax=Taibaiella koreensis TaxID=1268548 RepID=UPI000E59DEAB|nr:LytTR family DNA-binding domain-containing protein [Taibaiella koreensis]